MKAGTVEKILSLSKVSIRDSIDKNNIPIKKTISGENIFRWEHVAKLKYIHDFKKQKLKTKIISICQNKGGVGKTTSTINIASLFSYIAPTLVIDLDSQANLSQSFDVYSKPDDITLTDCLTNPENTIDAIKNISKNLDIIPNHLKFERWKRVCRNTENVEFSLRKALKSIKDNYTFILIDTPPALDISLELSLYASDYCIIPFEPHPFGLEGITNIIEEMQYIQSQDKTGSLDIKILGIFITLYEKGILSDEIIETLKENYNVLNSMIKKAVSVQQAQAVKKSIFDYDETSTASTDYYNLAFEILEKII